MKKKSIRRAACSTLLATALLAPHFTRATCSGFGSTDHFAALGATQAYAYQGTQYEDAYFEAILDLTHKTSGNPEVIWETGNTDIGFSLLYLSGNILGLYLDTRSGETHTAPELYIEYRIPDHILNRTSEPLVVFNWSIDMRGDGTAAISLWVDDEQVKTATGAVANQTWSSTNANASFGVDWGPVGGAPLAFFASATGFDDLASYSATETTVAFRYWADKHIVSPEYFWEGGFDLRTISTVTSPRRYLHRDSNDDVIFTTTAPGSNTDAQWRAYPVEPGSEWHYLVSESSSGGALDVIKVDVTTGQLVVADISSESDPTELAKALWKWDGTDTTPSAGDAVLHERLVCLYDAGGVRHITTRDASNNPISDGFAYALTSVPDSWTEAHWSKHDYVSETPTVTGAEMPFITLQAEDGTLRGANAAILGDDREEGGAGDLGATAREAVGRKAVKLGEGASVEFTLPSAAEDINFMAVRYSIPDDYPDWAEETLTVQVSIDGGETFEDLSVRQMTRLEPAAGSTPAYIKAESASSHEQLYLHTRHMWNYWRYANFIGRLGNHPLDDPSPDGINPDHATSTTACGIATDPYSNQDAALISRNKVDDNGDGLANDGVDETDPDCLVDDEIVDWLEPLAIRRFAEVRAFLDTSSLTGRTNGLEAGDIIRMRNTAADTAEYYIIDLIDIESVPAPLSKPTNYISIDDESVLGSSVYAIANDDMDDDAAFEAAIALVRAGTYDGVWVPEGFFQLGKRLDFAYADEIAIQGAGAPYSIVFGSRSGPEYPDIANVTYDPAEYSPRGFRNFGFNAPEGGTALKISHLSLIADGTDRENGGKVFGGSFGIGSEFHDLYIRSAGLAIQTTQTENVYDTSVTTADCTDYPQQHMRTLGLHMHDCRVRDVSAGGIIIVSGAHNVLIEDCHVRGTGDDGYAIWSVGSRTPQATTRVIMRDSTSEAAGRGNGFAIYGGYHNLLQNIIATDANRAGIWVAGNFRPLPFGRNQYEMTYVRDFLIENGGRADSIRQSTGTGYDPTTPNYRPGTEIFRGAFRITNNTWSNIDTNGTPNDTSDDTLLGFDAVSVTNLLIKGGQIEDSTNDGFHFNWQPVAFNPAGYTECDESAGSCGSTQYVVLPMDNVIISNVDLNTIPDDASFAAVQADDDQLEGSVIINNIDITGVGAGAADLSPDPSTYVEFIDTETGADWAP